MLLSMHEAISARPRGSLTCDSILTHLPVLHQVHDGQHGRADAGWEHCLRGLRHVVVGRVLGGVLLVCRGTTSEPLLSDAIPTQPGCAALALPTQWCSPYNPQKTLEVSKRQVAVQGFSVLKQNQPTS